MKLSIGGALSNGFERVLERNGLLLVAIVYVLTIIESAVGPKTAFTLTLPRAETIVVNPRPLLAIPVVFDALLSLAVAVTSLFVTIAALRVFATDETETLPREAFTDNAGWTLLNVVVGVVVFSIIVALGFVALVIPGLYLLSALFLWVVFVAVEDQNFVDALASAWKLTSGHRLRTFLLGVAFFAIALLVGLVIAIPGMVLGRYGFLLTDLGQAFVTVFGHAVLVAVYQQLSENTPETTTSAAQS